MWRTELFSLSRLLSTSIISKRTRHDFKALAKTFFLLQWYNLLEEGFKCSVIWLSLLYFTIGLSIYLTLKGLIENYQNVRKCMFIELSGGSPFPKEIRPHKINDDHFGLKPSTDGVTPSVFKEVNIGFFISLFYTFTVLSKLHSQMSDSVG